MATKELIDRVLAARAGARRLVVGLVSPEILEIEERRQRLTAWLRIHWQDDTIDAYELIREDWEDPKGDPSAKERNLLVYIDPELDVDWIAEVPNEAQASIALVESVGARKCKHLARDHVLHFRRLLGQAIVNAAKGEYPMACELAQQAERFLEDRTVELSRRWTLCFAHGLVLALSAVLAFVISMTCRGEIQLVLGGIWIAVQGGLVGAYLSILRKTGQGRWDSSAGLWTHLVEVLTKLSAGAVFGGIVFAVTRSVHAPPSLRSLVPDACSLFVFGIAAGWAERLVPKIISAYGRNLNPDHPNEKESRPD